MSQDSAPQMHLAALPTHSLAGADDPLEHAAGVIRGEQLNAPTSYL